MNWYAIQVTTGKEAEVIDALKDFGSSVLRPYTSVFFKRSGNISLKQKPLMPGYVIAGFKVTDFYTYKRNQRVEGMMQRLCGNGYESVPLNQEEMSFIRLCCSGVEPLILKKQATPAEEKSRYEIINFPPWAQYAFIEFYDIAKFRVKLHIRTTGAMKDHTFSTAAYSLDSQVVMRDSYKTYQYKDPVMPD